jgi:hypothetical protein
MHEHKPSLPGGRVPVLMTHVLMACSMLASLSVAVAGLIHADLLGQYLCSIPGGVQPALKDAMCKGASVLATAAAVLQTETMRCKQIQGALASVPGNPADLLACHQAQQQQNQQPFLSAHPAELRACGA